MGKKRRNLFVILFVLAMTIGSLVLIASKETKLGLDLSGGTRLVYQAVPTGESTEVALEDVDRSIDIVRDRVDSLGVSEPEIARVGSDQIQVDLPDVQNAERAIEQVGTTAQLFLYDLEPNVVPKDAEATPEVDPRNLEQQLYSSQFDAVERASKRPEECQNCTTSGPRFYLFDSETKEMVAGPAARRSDLFAVDAAKKLPKNKQQIFAVPQGTIVAADPPQQFNSNNQDVSDLPDRYFVIKDRPALEGSDIEDPQQSNDQLGLPVVSFDFTNKGREAFQEVTREIARRGLDIGFGASNAQEAASLSGSFAVVLDGRIESRPIINFLENPDGIDGRTGAQISGNFTIQEAQDLANILRIGALPVELNLISRSTVSATLGKQALDQGVLAGGAGLIIVILFLLAYYRFLGFVAALGLLVYGIFFFALIKAIPVTMTLPGIAGLILTIGVAADSNIVIFERIKEEARKGKSMPSAIASGYKHGIATIIDANVITLLTAFILFVLATAGVKGFAFTLGVGTLVSLFTAVVFSQALLGALGRSKILRSPAFLGAGEQKVTWRYDFAGASRWFFSVSGAILAVGAISFATAQLNFGIDFESGTRITVALTDDPAVDELRDTLGAAGIENTEGTKIQELTDTDLEGNVFQIQTQELQPSGVDEVRNALDREYTLTANDAFDDNSVGPTFGQQIARSAGLAIIFSLILIAAYMAFRFEAKYAIPVMLAVIHDILITGGVYSLSDREVTSATVAAFLTILGYSLYDTVIVFDRIRENVPRMPRATFSQIANRSLSEVLTRSLITGLSTVFLITVILLFGGETLGDFAFAMMIGVLSGTYSSIFIATPVLIAWKERESGYRARRARILEAMGRIPAFPDENEVARIGAAERHEGGAGTDKDQIPVPTLPQVDSSAIPGVAGGGPELAEPPLAPLPPDAGESGSAPRTIGEVGGDRPAGTESDEAIEGGTPERPSGGKKKSRRQRRRKHGRNR